MRPASRCLGDPVKPARSQYGTIAGRTDRSFLLGQQARIAASRRSVDRQGLFGGEPAQIVGAARLGTAARHSDAAEWLRADDSTDHVAVDVDVAGAEPRDDMVDGRLDTRRDSEREAVTGTRNVIEQQVELIGA